MTEGALVRIVVQGPYSDVELYILVAFGIDIKLGRAWKRIVWLYEGYRKGPNRYRKGYVIAIIPHLASGVAILNDDDKGPSTVEWCSGPDTGTTRLAFKFGLWGCQCLGISQGMCCRIFRLSQ